MSKAEFLIRDLPDPESAQRFLDQLAEKYPSQSTKLLKNDALLSDVLTLVSFSPLLATTLLQNPEYLWWLNRKRSDSTVRNKDELLESLARFSLTNSQTEANILLARFRRRELLRIFLSDIRRLTTIAEITEEISNLADAILENALRIARQELDNRYGSPLEVDAKGRKKPAEFCIVSLGKLGSKELNYSSDIDLLFLYSAEGTTSGAGSRGAVTNREYFIKLAESITKLVGQQAGEGAAYRVDLRLRPYGRVGPLAMSVGDTVRYYTNDAGNWERQVLIRSRASAGDLRLYKRFFGAVENSVFSTDETVENALRNVRLSKQKIDLEHKTDQGIDVKLGKGGIREIEFIAQALQLAYGGRDKWLRAAHTLISLSRLGDRKLISDGELTELFDAYEFLRHLEHILQMEHGLQTHLVPNDSAKRALIARRMIAADSEAFERSITKHTDDVNRVFMRVFSENVIDHSQAVAINAEDAAVRLESRSATGNRHPSEKTGEFETLKSHFPRFAELLSRIPQNSLSQIDIGLAKRDYLQLLGKATSNESDFGGKLAALRKTWSNLLREIIEADIYKTISLKNAKRAQTELAEASIATAIEITRTELNKRYEVKIEHLPLAILGLGKLGGAGIDYDSDLDLVLVYDETSAVPSETTHAEFYSRTAEIFVNVLSGMTRDGSLYRVDLRLRPHGKNGSSAISRTAFVDYMTTAAAIWEMLAYVKLRGVAGDIDLANNVEAEIRNIIHERASQIDPSEIADETRRIRLQLEKQRSRTRRGGDIDIKYGSGGMLDVYFAMRYLQLRDNVPDDAEHRSTDFMLERLHEVGSLVSEDHNNFLEGYRFLSDLDHNLRLTVGRTTRLPLANTKALAVIAGRMELASVEDLLEQLTLHRLNIRSSFDNILDH
jgi:glutamate-ammonia-ligase adenylyltransferase